MVCDSNLHPWRRGAFFAATLPPLGIGAASPLFRLRGGSGRLALLQTPCESLAVCRFYVPSGEGRRGWRFYATSGDGMGGLRFYVESGDGQGGWCFYIPPGVGRVGLRGSAPFGDCRVGWRFYAPSGDSRGGLRFYARAVVSWDRAARSPDVWARECPENRTSRRAIRNSG